MKTVQRSFLSVFIWASLLIMLCVPAGYAQTPEKVRVFVSREVIELQHSGHLGLYSPGDYDFLRAKPRNGDVVIVIDRKALDRLNDPAPVTVADRWAFEAFEGAMARAYATLLVVKPAPMTALLEPVPSSAPDRFVFTKLQLPPRHRLNRFARCVVVEREEEKAIAHCIKYDVAGSEEQKIRLMNGRSWGIGAQFYYTQAGNGDTNFYSLAEIEDCKVDPN